MKKVFIVLSLFAGISLAKAKPVTPAVAQAVAESFYKKNAKVQLVNLTLAYTEKSANGLPVYYAFNVNSHDGFVLITADDAAHPVIGYSTKNQFVVPQVTSNIGYWLSNRKKEVEDIRNNNRLATNEITREWSGVFTKSANSRLGNNASTMAVSVGPLCQSTWDQSGGGSVGYNNLCPGGSVTGCVATAMAQIMRYWSYPPVGTGSSSYCDCTADSLGGTPFTNTYGTQSANYGATTYNWSAMPLTSSNANVAQLMYQCGVSVDMDYAPSGSGAWVITADDSICSQTSYVKYFGYDPFTIQGLYRSNYSDPIWTQMMINELVNGRIVQYVGNDPTEGGHTWVLDGVDTNNYFHMNWGWGGSDNGFFSLNNLLTTNGGFNPSLGHEAVIGIEPLPHHAVDAGITFVSNPNQTFCATTFTPNVTLQNFGASTLTSCTLNFQLDNGIVQTQSWTGSLSSGQSANVILPSMTAPVGTHSFTCYTSNPNGAADSNALNDKSISFFTYVTSVSSVFLANQSTLCFVPAPVQFTSSSTNVTSYNWSFGDGTGNTTANPMHTYTASGTYNVRLIASTCSGTLADTVTTTISITTPVAPVASGTTTCGSTSAILSATGSGTIVWQDAAGNQLGTGSTFTTPTLTANTTYYAVNTTPFASVYGAPAVNTTLGAGAYLNAAHSLVFNANQAITLKSVDVYAQNMSAQPVIQLQDNMGNVLKSYTPTISTSGLNTITLNWNVGPGTGYLLAATGNNVNLYRNALTSGAVPYPFNIGSLVSITGSDVDSAHYYYFYNWQVEQEACASPAVPVSVIVQNCAGIKQAMGINNQLTIYPNPATDILNIECSMVNENATLKIIDMLGNIVKQVPFNTQHLTLSIADLAAGVYMIQTQNGLMKMVKQ